MMNKEESFNNSRHHIKNIGYLKIMVNYLKQYIKYLYVPLGAILGFSYYYFIGCKNGCPIQSNPYISSLYGAALGLVFAIPSKNKVTRENDNHKISN